MKHITALLRETGLRRQSTIDWLQQLWLRAAPEHLRSVCVPLRIDGTTLVLCVDTSVWLGRVRQQQQSLIRQLRKTREFSGLQSLRLELRPREIAAPVRRQRKPVRPALTQAQRKLFLATADQVSDTALAEALRRLAASRPED